MLNFILSFHLTILIQDFPSNATYVVVTREAVLNLELIMAKKWIAILAKLLAEKLKQVDLYKNIFSKFGKDSYSSQASTFLLNKIFYYTIELGGVLTYVGSCVTPRQDTKSECETTTGDAGQIVTMCLCKEDLCNMSSRIQAPLLMTMIAIFLASKM